MDNPARLAILRGMKRDCDILIAGGGLNGPALALALAQGGFSVAVVDARPAGVRAETGFDGRAYALALGSQRLLSAIGVWALVGAEAQPILGIRTCDGQPGSGPAPFVLAFDHAEIEEGPMGYMLEDRFLYAGFLDAMRAEPRIELIAGDSVTGQETGPGGVTVTLASGRHLGAAVLVGCDGRQSGVAERAGIKRNGWDYGQIALVNAVEHERPHDGVAHQFFLPGGPFAILPLPGNRSSIVWSEQADTARAISALPDDEYLALLRVRFGDFLGKIALTGTRFTYPLSLSLAERFTAPRVVLVGDAAHGVHPIAGQGLNLGLRDVGALAEVLVLARRRGEDVGAGDVLERYQQWRRFDATALALGMDAVNRLFSNDNPVLRLGRSLGLGAVNAMPGLRRHFIREAAGLSGDLPRLLSGRPI